MRLLTCGRGAHGLSDGTQRCMYVHHLLTHREAKRGVNELEHAHIGDAALVRHHRRCVVEVAANVEADGVGEAHIAAREYGEDP